MEKCREKDGECEKTVVKQRPVRELEHWMKYGPETADRLEKEGCRVYDLQVSGIRGNRFRALLAGGLQLDYHDGRFEMRFEDSGKESPSGGRGLRYVCAGSLENVRILADVSSVEVFVNDGEYVFSTRYYPEDGRLYVEAEEARIRLGEPG